MRACVAQCQNADPVFSRRNHAAHGALFFALAAGAASFLVSMALLLWLGLAAGIERFQIEFYTAWKQPMSRLEIVAGCAAGTKGSIGPGQGGALKKETDNIKKKAVKIAAEDILLVVSTRMQLRCRLFK